MRTFAPALPLLLAVAGCDPADATCDADTCLAACASIGLQPGGADPQRRILSRSEADRLRTELDDLRHGARFEADGAGVCSGAVGCDQAFGTGPRPLPLGEYHLHLPYTLPARAQPATWSVRVFASCVTAGTANRFEDAQEELRQGQQWLDAREGAVDLLPFRIEEGQRELACAWRAFLAPRGGEGAVLEGRYRYVPTSAVTPTRSSPSLEVPAPPSGRSPSAPSASPAASPEAPTSATPTPPG
jgi:hypothetical protein